MRRSRDLGLDLCGKKSRSWTGLRREEVEILDWTKEGRSRDLGLDWIVRRNIPSIESYGRHPTQLYA